MLLIFFTHLLFWHLFLILVDELFRRPLTSCIRGHMKSRRFAIERHCDTEHSARLNTYSDRESDQYAVELLSPGFWPQWECRLLCSCQLLTLQLEHTMMLISLIRVCVAWWKVLVFIHPFRDQVCVFIPPLDSGLSAFIEMKQICCSTS